MPIVCLLLLGCAAPGPPVLRLAPGVPVSAGLPVQLSLALSADDFVDLDVVQTDTDLRLTLTGPGLDPLVVDGFMDPPGRERLCFVAPRTGVYHVAVEGLTLGPGSFRAQTRAWRSATTADTARALADRRLYTALAQSGTARTQGLEAAAEAADAAKDAGRLGDVRLHQALDRLRAQGPAAAVPALARAANILTAAGEPARASKAWIEIALPMYDTDPPRAATYLALARAAAEEARAPELSWGYACGAAYRAYRQGRFLDAIGAYAAVLDGIAELDPVRMQDTAMRAREEMGLCYKATGRTTYARDLFEQAHAYWEARGRPDLAVRALTEIADTYKREGDFSQAEALFRRARDMAHTLGDPAAEGGASDRLGSTLRDMGRMDEARAAYAEALRLVAAQPPDQAGHVHANLAELHLMRDAPTEALAEAEAARALFDRADLPFAGAHTWMLTSQAYRALGREEDALAAIEESLARIDSAAASPGNRLGARYFTGSHFQYHLRYVEALLALWEARPAHAALMHRAFEVLERARAYDLVERLASRRTDPAPSPPTAALDPTLESVAEAGASASTPAMREALRRAETGSLRARETLARTPPSPTADLAAVQEGLLDDETTLLAFTLSEPRSYLWVVTRDTVHLLFLPSAARLTFAADNLTALWSSPHEGLSPLARKTALDLSTALLGEALPYIRGRRLLVVKDGALHALPFAALPDPRRPDTPLNGTYALVGLPSATTGLLLHHQKPRSDRRVVAFTDPVFAPDDPRLPPGGRAPDPEAYPRLLHSSMEADTLARLVPAEDRTLISGVDATRERFLTETAAPAAIVHLALHGALHPRHTELSRLVFSCYDADGARDGMLRAYVLQNLSIQADLVALGGCKTALGKVYPGEGPWSLGRDFLAAGARGVLVSLWDVNDRATAELMQAFYEGLLGDGLGPDEALQRARTRLRARHPAPYFWASFILEGDWRRFSQKN